MGAEAYTGARVVRCRDTELRPGAGCPHDGCRGKLYDTKHPAIFIRLAGQPLVGATQYEQEVRCAKCQQRYIAPLPEGVKDERYDATCDATIALMRYGGGLPWHRQAGLQAMGGIPLGEATMWERCEATADAAMGIFLRLTRLAADGEVMHTDDTWIRILSCLKEDKEEKGRATQTGGIVVKAGGRKIALYLSGRRHAGENLAELLTRREEGLARPIQMSDALAANTSVEKNVIRAYCLAHARRKVFELREDYPAECAVVLDAVGKVYGYEAEAAGMDGERRLAYHQEKSGPVMKELKQWFEARFSDRKVEPNSNLGKALQYWLSHWEELTVWLREPGTPIDNNESERALKQFILMRKNSMFFKSDHGAAVGDILADSVDKEAPSSVYLPILLSNFSGNGVVETIRHVKFVIRSPRAGSESLMNEIRQAVWSVAPYLPLAEVNMLDYYYNRSMARTSFTLVMLAVAGSMALLLGVVDLYGVIAYSVSIADARADMNLGASNLSQQYPGTDVGLHAVALPSGVRFLPGPVNGLLVNGRVLVYGDTGGRVKEASHVLFTHARRDVVWAGTALVRDGSAAVVPERERSLFENPASFWESYWSGRFHDYSQVNTKVLREPVRVSRAVRGGEVLDLDGVRVEVIDTPGYTAGAVSYWIESGGKRIACTGDIIYGDGQLFDVSSLQDAIPESKTRGYHGYAARAGDLIESLRKIAARKPDVLAPARGPLIENPQQAIERLITRLQGLMASHFATDALRWYWGEESLRIRSRKAMDGRAVDSMPMAEQRPLPDWVKAIGNSRLLVSRTGAGFLVDAGFKGLLTRLQETDRVQGIWITHYHDDHTDYAQTIANRFACPVYFTQRMRDVLERPSHYRLPCLTENPITSGRPQADGVRMRWHEFELTFFDFPGQTLYHGGLLVERDGGEKLFFVGDSFTPSGIDDYCLQNRDFAREGEGFLYCLELLDRLGKDAPLWLINQHVEPMFRFSAEQSARMRSELRKRMAILQELAPWPDLNYAIDESWAAVAPYGSEVRSGERVPVQVRILNHSAKMETYRLKWNVPSGWHVVKADEKVTIGPRKEGSARAVFAAAGEGLCVITADIEFGGKQLREWTEGLVRVRP